MDLRAQTITTLLQSPKIFDDMTWVTCTAGQRTGQPYLHVKGTRISERVQAAAMFANPTLTESSLKSLNPPSAKRRPYGLFSTSIREKRPNLMVYGKARSLH
eukprot:1139538-Prorocentrum_minimum.AAC.3